MKSIGHQRSWPQSIYGGKFNDEAGGLALRHAKRGLLSMANSGRDTNGSQFFILFKPAHHLNGKHCVFGELVEGQATLDWADGLSPLTYRQLDAIEGVKTTSDDKPIAPITIARCGQVERRVVGVRPVKRKKAKEVNSSSSESSSSEKKKKKKTKKDKKKKKKDRPWMIIDLEIDDLDADYDIHFLGAWRSILSLIQVETSVQSLANDGIKAMAGQHGDSLVKSELEKALKEDLSVPDVQAPVPTSADEKGWPALTSLSALSRLARRPPASALGKFSGALQVLQRGRNLSSEALMQRLRGESTALAPPDEIRSGLYISGLPSFLDHFEELKQRGVRHILNAADSSLHRAAGLDVEAAGMRLHTFEADDHDDGISQAGDLLARLRAASAFAAEGRRANNGVLVHCASGISRSSTLCMAHLMLSEVTVLSDGMSGVEPQRRSSVGLLGQTLCATKPGSLAATEMVGGALNIGFAWLKRPASRQLRPPTAEHVQHVQHPAAKPASFASRCCGLAGWSRLSPAVAATEGPCVSSRAKHATLRSFRQAAEEALERDPPQHTWLPEGKIILCVNALQRFVKPHLQDILAKLVQMTAGAGMFPGDDEVDQLWIEMDAAARAPDKGEETTPRWSHARLREEGGLAESAFATEFLRRSEAVQDAMMRGLWTEIPESVDPELLEVYVTHLTNDDYVVGAEILAASLAATGTTRPLVALVTDELSRAAREALRRAGWLLMELCHVANVAMAPALTPRVLRNLDNVFQDYGHFGLAAAADSQPHMDGEMISQTGFLVLRPCPERFSELWVLCSGSERPMKLDDWKHFEQGFFTIYFDSGEELADHGGGCGLGWHELKPEYNFTVRYCKRPLFEGLSPKNAAVVHFACAKPWDWAQKNFSPAPYVKMYLEFAKAAGIVWKTVECSADRARDRVNQEKMREIQARGGSLHELPAPSSAAEARAAAWSPRRWASPQLRVVVLSKDHWLHCFQLEASRLQALSSGGGAAPAHGTGIEGLEALEAEPQWSMYAPSMAVLPVPGKPRYEMCHLQPLSHGTWSNPVETLLHDVLTRFRHAGHAPSKPLRFGRSGFPCGLPIYPTLGALPARPLAYGHVFRHDEHGHDARIGLQQQALSLGQTLSATCLGPTLLGLWRSEYGVSYGYGSAVALSAYLLWRDAAGLAAVHLFCLVLYGVRLNLFLLWRELCIPRFREMRNRIEERAVQQGGRLNRLPFIVTCALLYLGLVAPGVLVFKASVRGAQFGSGFRLALLGMYVCGILFIVCADSSNKKLN
eukprot:s436_g36.t1